MTPAGREQCSRADAVMSVRHTPVCISNTPIVNVFVCQTGDQGRGLRWRTDGQAKIF